MQTVRLNRVRILAATFELAQPAVTALSSEERGFALSARVPCRTCHGAGRLLGPVASKQACHRCRRGEPRPHNCRQCAVCHGSGLALVDPYDVDAVQLQEGLPDAKGRPTTLPFQQPQAEAGPSRAEALQRRIERQLLIAAGKWDEAYRGEPAGAQAIAVAAAACGQTIPFELWLGGHYAEFGAAWSWLQAEWPGRAGFFQAGHMEGRYRRLDGKAQARADVGLVLVASRMPERVRVPSFLEPAVQNGLRKTALWRGRHPETAAQRAQRDAEIVRRVVGGESPTKLGREFSLDRRQVQRIVAAAQPVATAAA